MKFIILSVKASLLAGAVCRLTNVIQNCLIFLANSNRRKPPMLQVRLFKTFGRSG